MVVAVFEKGRWLGKELKGDVGGNLIELIFFKKTLLRAERRSINELGFCSKICFEKQRV
jgi:hypothetical protein